MAQVELFKKVGKYKDKNGNEKNYVNFQLKCGDTFIPIEVSYFEDKETGKDNKYGGRREVLKAFADTLLEKSTAEA